MSTQTNIEGGEKKEPSAALSLAGEGVIRFVRFTPALVIVWLLCLSLQPSIVPARAQRGDPSGSVTRRVHVF